MFELRVIDEKCLLQEHVSSQLSVREMWMRSPINLYVTYSAAN